MFRDKNISEAFRSQIHEDIEIIQEEFSDIDPHLEKDEYAFNYWVLSRLYNIDEDVIKSQVTDYNDKGIDCFVHYEDTKELYIIQNKYYNKDTNLDIKDVTDFLQRPLNVLYRNEYTRSEDLQKIFNKAKDDSEYKIYLYFYVTNNKEYSEIEKQVKGFKADDRIKAVVSADFFKLDDIRQIYNEERFTDKKYFRTKLLTINKGTSLNVLPDQYGLKWMLDLRFMFINVVSLYDMYKEAVEKNYAIFEDNIRNFLGTSGINNGIISTLKDKENRENFFYYNNGITIICDKIDTLKQPSYGVELSNPQIINGCQTINSIYEVLNRYENHDELERDFEKTYVLVKIFVLDDKNEKLKANIVKYTNSQNGIKEEDFAAKVGYFENLQKDFEKRGFLLLVKPSDKKEFDKKYSDKQKEKDLIKVGSSYFDKLNCDHKTRKDHTIPLSKLLKALLAFSEDAHSAFTKGNSLLKRNSIHYRDFSLKIKDIFTTDYMIYLYLLFKKSEIDMKKSDDKRTPIPYYVLSFIGENFKNTTNNHDEYREKLKKLFDEKELFSSVYDHYKDISFLYKKKYYNFKKVDYNKMIKQKIDMNILNDCFETSLVCCKDENLKDFLQK